MDWGLGHATRCIPVIRELIDMGCTVLVGGSGPSIDLLREEFPSLPFILLPGYDPVYDRTSALVGRIASQLPRMLRTINDERKLTEEIISKHDVRLVLSDNRYGCRSDRVRSIFIGHQMNLLSPPGLEWLLPVVNRLHRSFLRKFHECWIPDWHGDSSIAGTLSMADGLAAKYIGPLSRFNKKNATRKRYAVTFILSGPEPQRTLLEQRIVSQAGRQHAKMCLIRGVEDTVVDLPVDSADAGNLEVFGRLNARQVEEILASSELVVARSGYSTIMDLTYLGGKAVFVPTPGQPEQEYLAHRMETLGIAGFVSQEHFDLDRIHALSGYSGFEGMTNDHTRLRNALQEALQ